MYKTRIPRKPALQKHTIQDTPRKDAKLPPSTQHTFTTPPSLLLGPNLSISQPGIITQAGHTTYHPPPHTLHKPSCPAIITYTHPQPATHSIQQTTTTHDHSSPQTLYNVHANPPMSATRNLVRKAYKIYGAQTIQYHNPHPIKSSTPPTHPPSPHVCPAPHSRVGGPPLGYYGASKSCSES